MRDLQGKGVKTRNQKERVASLPKSLRHINIDAAGIDVGSEMHMVAVPEDRDEKSVREFSGFTDDLKGLADWLKKCGVKTVAMESTGVYWIPLYEILESRGFEVKLVDARHVKNVTGRKSDVLDCQWIQQLHTYGLLSGAFRPADEIVVLRSYIRQREMLVRSSVQHIQHMQKALQQMNVQLYNVVTEITGVTGMKIIKAILKGERDPEILALNRDRRCQQSSATIAKSLVGNYRQEHLFSLRQALELYEIYQAKIDECEREIVEYLNAQPNLTDDGPGRSGKTLSARDFMRGGADIRETLFKKSGVDLFAIPGLSADTLLMLAGEVGFDLSPWKTVKHFTSWLGVCPSTQISGGKRLKKKAKRKANRAAQCFRTAAATQARSKSALGAFFRRVKARSGGKQAVIATAHKIARIFYALLSKGQTYVELGQQAYEEQFMKRRLEYLKTQAKSFGFQLVEDPN